MTCPNCGFESSHVFYFCSGCGVAVASGVAVVDPAAISNAKRWGVFAATLLLPLIGVAMGTLYIVDARDEQRALGRLWLIAGVALTLVYAALLAWL
jgi:hypothetical protein